MAQSQSLEPGVFPTEGIWPITFLLMASGFAIEVSRKFKAPFQERETVDSYQGTGYWRCGDDGAYFPLR